MAKQAKGELVVVHPGFDYTPLEPQVAEGVRSAAQRIREKVRGAVEGIIGGGHDLLAIKDSLPHGQFGPWLRAEFGWTERTARHFMAVAEHFGPKSDIISDLNIAPTAAYLLTAPSVPDESRQTAIDRVESGEKITTKVAKEIVAQAKKKRRPKKQQPLSADQLGVRLEKVLGRYKERWNPKEWPEFRPPAPGVRRRSGEAAAGRS